MFSAPVLDTPSVSHKRGELPPNFTPRRSGRLAKVDRGLDSETKAKRVLLRRLGLLGEDEPISSEALEHYSRLFAKSLASDIVHAFTDFFSWTVPYALLDGVAPLLLAWSRHDVLALRITWPPPSHGSKPFHSVLECARAQ